jgi:hypothetical protein
MTKNIIYEKEPVPDEQNTIYRTRFYSDCIGIFQGGGCRAAAFGGAYDTAFKLSKILT